MKKVLVFLLVLISVIITGCQGPINEKGSKGVVGNRTSSEMPYYIVPISSKSGDKFQPKNEAEASVNEVFNDLIKKGVPKELLTDLKVYLVPKDSLRGGQAKSYVFLKDIWVASGKDYSTISKNALVHEVGHILQKRTMGFIIPDNTESPAGPVDATTLNNTDNSPKNELQKEYGEIKGYISKEGRQRWENYIDEWFAEDFKYFYKYKWSSDAKYEGRSKNGSKPGDEEKQFIEKLFEIVKSSSN